MINLSTAPVSTEHRAGRMLMGLITSANTRAKVLLTTDLTDANGGSRLHQTFAVKSWQGRGGTMLTVEVAGSGDWNAGTRAIKMFHVDAGGGRIVEANDPRNRDRLLRYAAEAAIAYAWFGDAGLPTPANGAVKVVESDNCGMCGRTLTDPVSIERGIGPECANKATGTRTIASRNRPCTPALFTAQAEEERYIREHAESPGEAEQMRQDFADAPPVRDEADDPENEPIEDEDGELARERYYDRLASEQTEIDRANGQF
jgi:hypothetical protein